MSYILKFTQNIKSAKSEEGVLVSAMVIQNTKQGIHKRNAKSARSNISVYSIVTVNFCSICSNIFINNRLYFFINGF